MPFIKNADELRFGEASEACSNGEKLMSSGLLAAVFSVPQPAVGSGVSAASLNPPYTLTDTWLLESQLLTAQPHQLLQHLLRVPSLSGARPNRSYHDMTQLELLSRWAGWCQSGSQQTHGELKLCSGLNPGWLQCCHI